MVELSKCVVGQPAERDDLIEKWLKAEVAPVFDAMKAKPGRAVPAANAIAKLSAKRYVR